MEVNIIDTSQLMEDAGIIEYLAAEKKKKMFIPFSVQNEVSKKMEDFLLEKDIETAQRALFAKRAMSNYKYQKWIVFWKATTDTLFGDPAVQQLILEKMSNRSVTAINVYAFDKDLAAQCREQNHNKSIKHNCVIKTFRYKNHVVTETFNNPTNKEKIDAGFTSKKEALKYSPVSISDPDVVIFRDNKVLKNHFNKYNNLALEPSPVRTVSGFEKALKYWVYEVKKNDNFRIFKKMQLHKGEKISVNVLTMNDSCNVSVGLLAYSESDNTHLASKKYVDLKSGQWVTLTLDIDDDKYNFINIDFWVHKDSSFDGYWNGTDGYIDGFKIERP